MSAHRSTEGSDDSEEITRLWVSANSCISAAFAIDHWFLMLRMCLCTSARRRWCLVLRVAVLVVLTILKNSWFLVYQIFDCCIIVIKPILLVFGLIAKYFFAYFGDVVAERGPFIMYRDILFWCIGESLLYILLELKADYCVFQFAHIKPPLCSMWPR